MRYGSVIFDMDGVILNSLVENEKWKFDAVRQALKEKGVDPEGMDRDELRDILGDRGYSAVVKKSSELGLNPGEIWQRVAETTTHARLQQIEDGKFELYPGAKDAIEHLYDEDTQMAVISNAPESAVEATMRMFDLKQYFEFYLGVRNFEDLQVRKPNPNHLELAKAELKRDPMAYVGDAENDVRAAKRAELASIWVNRAREEIDIEPDYEMQRLERLPEIVDGSS
ncbi:MAG: HAD family hydrolase [Candidatus Nanohaloarchaea archaeon]